MKALSKNISNNSKTVMKILYLKTRDQDIQNLMINWEDSLRKWKMTGGVYEETDKKIKDIITEMKSTKFHSRKLSWNKTCTWNHRL